MSQPTTSAYTVSDFLQWEAAKQLRIAAKFQRRSVWPLKAKSYIIDTILREKPIPPVFVRLLLDLKIRTTIREVVDGQQRIRSVLEYVRNEFPILKAHNEELAGQYFDDLSKDLQKRLLQYTFFVFMLGGVSDEDVLDIFARFNTYSVALNAQELRNAKFTGMFKRTAYMLGHKYNRFWTGNGIFADRQIARMLEVELVSELMATMLGGIQTTTRRELDKYYEDFDDDFPARDRVVHRFENTIDIIGELFDGQLKNSVFRRKPLFFSLFTAIYALRFGLPKENVTRVRFRTQDMASIAQALRRFENEVTRDRPPARYAAFVEAMNKATANQGNRAIRHSVLLEVIGAAV